MSGPMAHPWTMKRGKCGMGRPIKLVEESRTVGSSRMRAPGDSEIFGAIGIEPEFARLPDDKDERSTQLEPSLFIIIKIINVL